jgi:predicted nucleic acid-binding protein
VKRPSKALVLDAAVLVAAVRGRSSGAILEASRTIALITTERVVQEARRRIELGLKRPDLVAVLDSLLEEVTVVAMHSLKPLIVESETALRNAPASRNGSIKDAHVHALAWSIDADIWTSDRDFAGAGVATWSTPNLLRGLAAAVS